LDHALAAFLSHGTWLSCAVIAVGMALSLLQGTGSISLAALPGMRIVNAGVALLILLPAARVLLMLAAFIRQGERRYSLIAALVLLVIVAGFVVGKRMPGVAG
jgi:uncharacterized membrane protein